MAPPARTRPWRGLAPEERDAQRRERLLDAALELYGTQGYARTTVAALCARANVATRSLYELFGSSEVLLRALYDRIAGEVAEGIVAAMAAEPDDVEARVRAGVAATIGPLLADERKARILELEAVGVSDALEERRRDVARAFAALLDAELARMVELGMLPRRDQGLLTLIMVGGVTEVLVDHLRTPRRRRRSRAALVDAIADVWLRALR